MRTIIIIIVTVLLSIGLLTNLSAQSFEQVETQTLPASRSKEEVVDSFNTQSNGKLIQVLSKESSTKVVDQGPYKNVPVHVKQQSLLLPDGKIVDLLESEIFIGASSNSFFTEKNDFETLEKEISIYKIESSQVQKIKSLSASSEGKTVTLENGILIVSDEYEGYGTTVDIYSDGGELLLSYKPYDSGFKHAVFTSHQDYVYGCFESGDESSLSLIKFNALTNKEEYETELDISDFNLTTIVANENSAVIYGFDKLIAFDRDGKINWKREDIILPHFDLIISDDDALFFATQNDIVSMSLKNGNTNWKQEIKNVYRTTNQNQKLSIRPIVFKLLNDGKSLGVVIGMAKRGNLTSSDIKYNSELEILDNRGNVRKQIKLEKELDLIKILPTDSGFNLIEGHTIKKFKHEK